MGRPDEPKVDGGLQALCYWLDYLFERDYMQHSPIVMNSEHHHIHGGNLHNFGTHLASLDGSVSYLFYAVGTAITTKRPHFTHGIMSNGAISVHAYQNPTVVAPGTLLVDPPLMNHLIGGGTSTVLEVYINPNISNVGTQRPALNMETGGTGIGGATVTGAANRDNEVVFANDSYWLIVIETEEALHVNYNANWYDLEA